MLMGSPIKKKWSGYINIKEYINNKADFRRKTLRIKQSLLGGRKDEQWSKEYFQGSETILFETLIVDICHYTFCPNSQNEQHQE